MIILQFTIQNLVIQVQVVEGPLKVGDLYIMTDLNKAKALLERFKGDLNGVRSKEHAEKLNTTTKHKYYKVRLINRIKLQQ